LISISFFYIAKVIPLYKQCQYVLFFSPDKSKKLFEIVLHFFLQEKSDQRKLLFLL